MKAPQRLLEDPGASAQLRADLQRTAASAVRYDTTRGLAALQGALDLPASAEASGIGQAAGSGSAAVAAAGSTATSGIALKLALVAAIGGGLAWGGSWFIGRGDERAGTPATRTEGRAATDPGAPAASPAPSAQSVTRRKAPNHEPAVAPANRELPASAPAQALGSHAAAPPGRDRPAPSASRREIAQLVRIRALLERDPKAAHRAIEAAQREFPAGVLREEREGLDAIALFRSGETRRARARAAQFIARYPHSPLRPRLERLLAGEDP